MIIGGINLIALPLWDLPDMTLAWKVNNLMFDTQMMRLGALQPVRITLWASTNWPSSKARVTSVNSLSRLTRWSWQATAHPLKTSWILTNTLYMRETADDRKINSHSFEHFFEGPTLLSPFLSLNRTNNLILYMRETAGDRKIHFDSFEHFFEGPTLLSPFLSSRTLLSKPHFFEHFFELITQKSTFLSALLSTVTF